MKSEASESAVKVGRAAHADCEKLVESITDLLSKERTFSLDQMYLAAKEREGDTPGWLSGLLKEYLSVWRHVDAS